MQVAYAMPRTLGNCQGAGHRAGRRRSCCRRCLRGRHAGRHAGRHDGRHVRGGCVGGGRIAAASAAGWRALHTCGALTPIHRPLIAPAKAVVLRGDALRRGLRTQEHVGEQHRRDPAWAQRPPTRVIGKKDFDFTCNGHGRKSDIEVVSTLELATAHPCCVQLCSKGQPSLPHLAAIALHLLRLRAGQRPSGGVDAEGRVVPQHRRRPKESRLDHRAPGRGSASGIRRPLPVLPRFGDCVRVRVSTGVPTWRGGAPPMPQLAEAPGYAVPASAPRLLCRGGAGICAPVHHAALKHGLRALVRRQ